MWHKVSEWRRLSLAVTFSTSCCLSTRAGPWGLGSQVLSSDAARAWRYLSIGATMFITLLSPTQVLPAMEGSWEVAQTRSCIHISPRNLPPRACVSPAPSYMQ